MLAQTPLCWGGIQPHTPLLEGPGGLCTLYFRGPMGQGEPSSRGPIPGADGRLGTPLQVIVMSSHETIRVLEVGVDAPPPAEEDRKPSEMPPGEGAQGSPRGSGDPGREEVPPSTETSCSTEAAGEMFSCPAPASPAGRLGSGVLSGTSSPHPSLRSIPVPSAVRVQQNNSPSGSWEGEASCAQSNA